MGILSKRTFSNSIKLQLDVSEEDFFKFVSEFDNLHLVLFVLRCLERIKPVDEIYGVVRGKYVDNISLNLKRNINIPFLRFGLFWPVCI